MYTKSHKHGYQSCKPAGHEKTTMKNSQKEIHREWLNDNHRESGKSFHVAFEPNAPWAAQRPKLSGPARGTRGMKPERDGRVRWSAWLAFRRGIFPSCFDSKDDVTLSRD